MNQTLENLLETEIMIKDKIYLHISKREFHINNVRMLFLKRMSDKFKTSIVLDHDNISCKNKKMESLINTHINKHVNNYRTNDKTLNRLNSKMLKTQNMKNLLLNKGF